jgi:enoyl-CoA hydratase/carnithine racemase
MSDMQSPHAASLEAIPASGHLRRTQIEAQVEIWTIDRSERRNALSPELLAELRHAAQTKSNGIVILASSDPNFFCAGFDLDALEVGVGTPDQLLIATTQAIASSKAIFIAQIDGQAIGGGVELACACDLMVASSEATICVPAAALGVVYHGEGIDRLSRAFGGPLARRLLLSGAKISVLDPQARSAFVNVVARESLAEVALDLASKLARVPNEALLATARWLRQGLDHSPDDLVAHEETRRIAYASEAHQAALQNRRRKPAPSA